MQIKLNLDQDLFSPKFFPFLFDYSHRFEIYKGSAGSGKSYFITQKLLIRALSQKIRILVCRRYASTIRQSTFSLFKQMIGKWKLTQYAKVNESDFRITLTNGSEILFCGLDAEEKLLSLNDISTVWIEEAFEVSKDMVEQLNLRMRGTQTDQQIILSFNPVSKESYLYDFCEVHPPQNSLYLTSTFRDNPFLNKEYVSSLEELYSRNPAKARIYCDGEWGVLDEGLVFKNWEVQDLNAFSLSGLEHRAGSDVGYMDPTTIADTLYDREHNTIYIIQEFYKTGCQLDEIASQIKQMNIKCKLYCDSADPRYIDFLRQANINATASIKGAGSVKAGISFLQNHKIIIDQSCVNAIREFENFSYIKDKNGNYTENTTHEFSHFIDGLRYAYSDIYTKSRLRTLDKSVLGL